MYIEASESARSSFAVANPSEAPVTVSIQLAGLDGTPAGIPVATLTVPAGGQVTKFIDEVFLELNDGFKGIARLTASSGMLVSAFLGTDNERGDFVLTSTPLLDDSASRVVFFPYIVNGAGYRTEIITFGRQGSVMLSVIDSEPIN